MTEELLLHEPAGASHRTVPSGSARLAVEVVGSGPWIVALHPGVGDRRIWRACVPAWTEAGFGVVTYDRRGFGATTWEEEPHDDLADLLAVIDAACGDEDVVVVGNSMGGGLAVRLAAERPQRVRALVLIASSVSNFTPENWPETAREAHMDEQLMAADQKGDFERLNALETWYWLDGTEQPEGRVGGAARVLFLDMNGQALRAGEVGEAGQGPDLWQASAGIDAPMLVVIGEHDLPGISESNRALAERMPNASLVQIDGSAHCPSLDQPDALNSAVVAFLREHDLGGRVV